MVHLLSFICLICYSVFVRCIDLRAYGYIYNIYGDDLNDHLDFERVYFPFITPEFPEYNQSTECGYYNLYHSQLNFYLDFTFELTDIDAEYHFDLDNMTKNINNRMQNHWLNVPWSDKNEYIVISSIDVGIFSDYAGESNIETHLQNDKAWSIMYGDQNVSIISFTVIGSIMVNSSKDPLDVQADVSCQRGNFQYQYDLFYPNRVTASDPTWCADDWKYTTINGSFELTEYHYTLFRTKIVYETDINRFENDIEQNSLFDINLMNEKYINISNNGSFMYYGLGGICSGTLCTKYINWTEHVFDEIISTTEHSTQQPETTDSSVKFGTSLSTIISSILFIISIQ